MATHTPHPMLADTKLTTESIDLAEVPLAMDVALSLPELLHMILVLNMEAPSMLPLQRVCRRWHDVIHTSHILRKSLYATGSTVQETCVHQEVAPRRRLDSRTNTWTRHRIYKHPDRESMIMHMYSSAAINFLPSTGWTSPIDLGPTPNFTSWTRVHFLAWVHAWLGADAVERWEDCYNFHGVILNARILTDAYTAGAFHMLRDYHCAKRMKRLHKLELNLVLPVPIGPCLKGDFIARAVMLGNMAVLCLPRSTLEAVDEMATSSKAYKTASWIKMPLTDPPVRNLLLLYYFSEGTKTVQVNQVVEKRPQWPFVVLGDLVGRLKEGEGKT